MKIQPYLFLLLLLLATRLTIMAQTYPPCGNMCFNAPNAISLLDPTQQLCAGNQIQFQFTGGLCGSDYITMGDGCSGPSAMQAYNPTNIGYTYGTPGTYTIEVYSTGTYCTYCTFVITIVGDCTPPNNEGVTPKCQSPFSPTPGDYILSFWVREDIPGFNGATYTSGMDVVLYNSFGPTFISVPPTTQFAIIDGWQKVEKTINIPVGTTTIDLKLKNSIATNDVFFDDIRFHPVNSGFKSYVYDPITLRLAAELDDRNYATFYEYDEEGQLIRVKKETEKGIKTIKESRTSVKKK